jgi:myo-inositol-1(or 4)-monophosphatase
LSTLNINTLIKTAIGAVLAGAKIAELTIGAQVVNHKGNLRDIVTQADIDISELLEKELSITGLPVISEEKYEIAKSIPDADVFWVVDPIDGTVNFSHGLPFFAVSVGLVEKGEFKLGVVCAPVLDELYFTLNTGKALLNGKLFKHVHLLREDALMAASFSAKSSKSCYDLFQEVNESTRGCLRTGSAALNICWAATGKLQAAYGFNAKLWDVAGALAIAKAAGCNVSLRYKPNGLLLDYCVGSQDAVNHIISLAKQHELWD